MTAPRHDSLDEREVDLGRWRRAVVTLWWIPVVGLVLGAIIGALYSLRGTSTFKAASLISLGQPVSPGGVVIASFGTNPRAVSQIVSSASAQAQAERDAGMRSGALRGHVSVAQVGTATGAGAARATPLISLTVQGANVAKTEAAANALARRVVALTTAPYVGTKIRTYQQVLETTNTQLSSINVRLAALNRAVEKSNLAPLDQLVLDQPDRQRRAAAGEPLRPEGDDAAAARVREERREREGDHSSRARRRHPRTRRRRR